MKDVRILYVIDSVKMIDNILFLLKMYSRTLLRSSIVLFFLCSLIFLFSICHIDIFSKEQHIIRELVYYSVVVALLSSWFLEVGFSQESTFLDLFLVGKKFFIKGYYYSKLLFYFIFIFIYSIAYIKCSASEISLCLCRIFYVNVYVLPVVLFSYIYNDKRWDIMKDRKNKKMNKMLSVMVLFEVSVMFFILYFIESKVPKDYVKLLIFFVSMVGLVFDFFVIKYVEKKIVECRYKLAFNSRI